jgi:hypothetical protein
MSSTRKEIMDSMKFKVGEKVYIEKLPQMMSHFKGECFAWVDGTYASIHGSDHKNPNHERNMTQYSLQFENGSISAWYHECFLRSAE